MSMDIGLWSKRHMALSKSVGMMHFDKWWQECCTWSERTMLCVWFFLLSVQPIRRDLNQVFRFSVSLLPNLPWEAARLPKESSKQEGRRRWRQAEAAGIITIAIQYG